MLAIAASSLARASLSAFATPDAITHRVTAAAAAARRRTGTANVVMSPSSDGHSNHISLIDLIR
ncbi:MAG: hypothetical protein ACM4D3_08280 [Candidatus Sericytochromatia bacterium]